VNIFVYFFECILLGKDGDIEYENIEKKKRGHRNGDIEKTGTSKTATSKLKSKKLKSKNYTSIPDRLL